ncbi:MAG: hypothetical protein EOP86_01335 [Verrucomicrobiaceae bacterium]|nr:MAG: hypothetical protein EOP86_01335 [Verrucomicrobiaceae bacterium]
MGAPGLTVAKNVTQAPFKVNHLLSNIYKYIFRGIEAKGNTLGAPGSSGSNGNGGQIHVSATVSGSKLGKLEFRDEQDFNTSPLKTLLLSPAVVWVATTTPISVDLQWMGEGNAKKPDMVFNILGEYQKQPPAPVGSLTVSQGQFILTGTKPDGVAVIVRE